MYRTDAKDMFRVGFNPTRNYLLFASLRYASVIRPTMFSFRIGFNRHTISNEELGLPRTMKLLILMHTCFVLQREEPICPLSMLNLSLVNVGNKFMYAHARARAHTSGWNCKWSSDNGSRIRHKQEHARTRVVDRHGCFAEEGAACHQHWRRVATVIA